MMLFLAFSARTQNEGSGGGPVLARHLRPSKENAQSRMQKIEVEKAEATYSHWTKRCELLSAGRGDDRKELMDAELKRELARLDLEMAKIKSE